MFMLLQLKSPVLLNMNCLPVTLLLKVGLQLITLQQRHRVFSVLPLLQHLLMEILWLSNHLLIFTHLLIFELYALLNTRSHDFYIYI